MKVLVRQATTGLYYQGAQIWVPDPNEARAFPDTLQAFDFCSNYTSREAHIYLFTPDHSDRWASWKFRGLRCRVSRAATAWTTGKTVLLMRTNG